MDTIQIPAYQNILKTILKTNITCYPEISIGHYPVYQKVFFFLKNELYYDTHDSVYISLCEFKSENISAI